MELVSTVSTIIAMLALVTGPWVVLAVLAVRFGVDSRPRIGDDHRRAGPGTSRWIGP
jgi:hypothetical protein